MTVCMLIKNTFTAARKLRGYQTQTNVQSFEQSENELDIDQNLKKNVSVAL